MKLLLDENLPHDLRYFLPGHDARTVAYMGWKGVRNGALLARAKESGFDVLLSADSGIGYQQNVATLPIAVVVLRSRGNSMDALRPLIPALLQALSDLQPRTLVVVA